MTSLRRSRGATATLVAGTVSSPTISPSMATGSVTPRPAPLVVLVGVDDLVALDLVALDLLLLLRRRLLNNLVALDLVLLLRGLLGLLF